MLFRFICIFILGTFGVLYAVAQEHSLAGKYLEDLPEKMRPSNYSTIIQSVKFYGTPRRETESGGMCSLVFISNDGYALTSKHCLQSQFTTTSKNTFSDPSGKPILVVENFEPKDLEINVTYLGRNSNLSSNADAIEEMGMKILAIGQGKIRNRSDAVTPVSVFEIERKNDIGFFSDYALVKLDVKENVCVKTSSLKENEEVFMVGYPMSFQIKDHGLGRQSITIGSACEPVSEFKKLSQFSKELIRAINETNAKINISKPDVIFHSARLTEGASGGGLFNKKGELIGINSFVFDLADEKKYTPGAYASLSIDKIKKLLKKKLTPEQLKQAFDCK